MKCPQLQASWEGVCACFSLQSKDENSWVPQVFSAQQPVLSWSFSAQLRSGKLSAVVGCVDAIGIAPPALPPSPLRILAQV
mmetsp:Transcript_17966/g.40760  ORF Transcript_17966/g.40760 Transcript_17966/m.40760 type:complete len:81 (-) Transcript_17966:1888-2130(-)